MRILHAYKIYRPDVNGGIPAVMAALTRIADRFKNKIIVARRFGVGRTYVIDGTSVLATSCWGTLFSMPIAPTFPWQLIKESREADVVVHHMPFPLTDLAIYVGFPKRPKLIVYWHADVVGRSFLKKLLAPFVRHSLKRADIIIVSNETVATGSPLLARHCAKLAIVPYGVNTTYWSTLDTSQQQISDHRRREHPRLIVAVGRLVHYKGYDVLLRALTQVEAHAVIIGDGPLRPDLEKLATTLGIERRVTFAGNVTTDEIKLWMHAARLLVLPSRTKAEAFGIVQIEAMAAGLPVVNTNLATAVPHIARNGLEGFTVESESPAELASAIGRLLDSADIAQAFGTAGRTRAIEEFDEVLFLNRMTAIYQQICQPN